MTVLDCRFRKRLADYELAVDLSVGCETVALVGRSGSGKTTTLRAVAGLLQPDEGTITLAGRALFDRERRVALAPEARRVGLLFQDYALFPHLSVEENVSFGLFRVARADRPRAVSDALRLVGLAGYERARPHTLSGGERQRVALARAVVTRPDALLLDEPLAALDVESRARIRMELRALLKEVGIPSIVVSHDFDDARVLGDRIAAMHDGRIVQIGSAVALAAFPADAFVARLTGTNVAHARDGGERVAFDPWRATLSRSSTGSEFEWRGEIVEIRPLGVATRVLVRCPPDIAVDVQETTAGEFRVGEVVFASVPRDATRRAAKGDASASGQARGSRGD
ncbi:MAG TPA: ABC transporter ATP-binding protein [Candidatus Eremiobacteraceae bacterium]|nr:ABC transporter ATP-binding protein [Candidatus Eremiobacteraceae bacterium]